MFTGLIQDVGTVRALSRAAANLYLTIETRFHDFIQGESIAAAGACLSVTDWGPNSFRVFASSETVAKTGVGDLRVGSRVNLERALKMGDPLGGHLVSGHVDARISLISRTVDGAAEVFLCALPEGHTALEIAPKGSVTLDGVSLTVNSVLSDRFTVMIIPLTLSETTLGALRPGDKINLETDVIAKYIARQLNGRRGADIDLSLLERTGFIR